MLKLRSIGIRDYRVHPRRRLIREAVAIIPIHCSRSVAGLGVSGPLGPRPGISSGILPGSSSGRGGSPGSCIGGGASGFGLPGGIPGGGSVGVPGVAGGISGGSIGIYIVTLRFSPRSGRMPVTGSTWRRG
jgi:hypothetical protein